MEDSRYIEGPVPGIVFDKDRLEPIIRDIEARWIALFPVTAKSIGDEQLVPHIRLLDGYMVEVYAESPSLGRFLLGEFDAADLIAD